MKILTGRGCTSIVPQPRMRGLAAASFSARAESGACAASTSRYLCRLGHAGNGDAMLAYHLMDFSRYFFDQSDIRH
ncbi:hypothetical protein [Herbaspirillum sp. CF444]|uniref:hypothetical protein n=1 Tax=Herbaspirillum sp. CF444 TaxID=1144319 RepID=UPI0012FA7D5E|nr:hypothetical protein [Herbaspirillum sp. CF444]